MGDFMYFGYYSDLTSLERAEYDVLIYDNFTPDMAIQALMRRRVRAKQKRDNRELLWIFAAIVVFIGVEIAVAMYYIPSRPG